MFLWLFDPGDGWYDTSNCSALACSRNSENISKSALSGCFLMFCGSQSHKDIYKHISLWLFDPGISYYTPFAELLHLIFNAIVKDMENSEKKLYRFVDMW